MVAATPRRGRSSTTSHPTRRAIAIAVALLISAPAFSADLADIDDSRDETRSEVSVNAEDGASSDNTVEFDRGFLRALGQSIDLSRFERDESVTEGSQPAELTVNDVFFGAQSVSFSRNPKSGRIEPCLSATQVARIGLDPARQLQPVAEGACVFLDQIVEGGSYEYDPGEQKLLVSVPQAFLRYQARGYVPPDALDAGINAATLRYTLNYANNNNSVGTSGQYLYGGLQSAFNYGDWRFRTYGSLTSNEGQPTRWDHVAAYAQRPIPSIQAEAIIGDWNTTGQLFDSTAVRGVSLGTDDRMLPESLRGYAPVVRGVARSNAVVTVRQGSNVIYESNVPPGEFEFKDLYATGYGGDLEVTVTESDGQTQQFIVPYGSIAQLLRAGYTKYALTMGQVRDDSLTHAPLLMEGTLQHGVTDDLTVYGGAQITASTYYAAVMAGLALNTPLGALGLDLTQSFTLCTDLASDCYKSGHSVRASIGKQFSETGTYFSLVGYRYSSAGYYSLMDALRVREFQLGNASAEPLRLRDRFDINVNQSLGPRWGSLFLTGSYGRRWEDSSRSLSFQAGYTNSWGPARYNLSVGRTKNARGESENSVFLSVSLPLGRSSTNPATVNVSASHMDGISDLRTTMTGSAGENGQTSYGAWFDTATGGGTSFGGSLGYTGNAAKGNVSYGHSRTSDSFGVNLSGGAVIHADGVNFASELGDTIALVEADGASGARVLPYSRTRVGDDGTAVVPYITPYQWNNVELDLKGADMGVQVENTRIVTAPTAGAVVKVKFDSKRSESVVLRISRPDGSPVPFGASVLQGDTEIGTVGGAGTVVAMDMPESALLTASWGSNEDEKCAVRYELESPAQGAGEQGVHVRDLTCEPVGATTEPAAAPKESS